MFLKIKNIHRIKNIKKHVFYRKIKHIKYVLNNYGCVLTNFCFVILLLACVLLVLAWYNCVWLVNRA